MRLSNKLEDIIRNNVKFDETAPYGYIVYQDKHIPNGQASLFNKVRLIDEFAKRHNGYCKVVNYPWLDGDNRNIRIEMNCDCVAAKAFDEVVEEKERPYIYLSMNKETSVWSVLTSPLRSAKHAVRFCEEKDYPVDLYYVRTDINGSSSIEKEVFENRRDLIKALNWLGECGYTPLKLWNFDAAITRAEAVGEIFDAGAKARSKKFGLSLDEQIADAVAMGKKEYSLVLCKGEQEEERVQAFLTDQEVALIKKVLAGELNTGFVVELTDGREIEAGIIDEITVAAKPIKKPGLDRE